MSGAQHDFRQGVAASLANPDLQRSLARIPIKFVQGRARAAAEFGDFEALRLAGEAIRERVLADLAGWLERFEAAAQARGVQVHWAADAAEANRIVSQIAREAGVRTAVKSKSMVSEEIELNAALAAAGVETIETDLGEYVLQLAQERPSHIVAPIIHKNREEVAELFEHHHDRPQREPGWRDDIAGLCREARETLRPRFLEADLGISGANFLIAETGSIMLVTNEGNGRLCTTLPRVHIAITGIEKVVPTLDDAATLVRLLTRSATGQPISNYVSLLTGPRDPGTDEGPEAMHVVLLDNGRSGLWADPALRPMLRCIRCGACMNHCPVYQAIGGHPYGWVYPGPMGSVLTPGLRGLDAAPDLPHAATLCGQCEVACPVRIPLPDMLRTLREKQAASGRQPWLQKLGFAGWGWLARRPRLYRLATRQAAALLRLLGDQGQIDWLPGGWTRGRTFPAPEGNTFQAQYRAKRAADE
ncbi:LutB/LldF family L-lactate oxidation iron-sulfur protein [Chitinimonas lacunae]|uniref:LutB/LldF family L-lactate oxidation iron-sulfur protein n=1 Tax=Chitinimonas lacunae TaxID=1963018 RepID=A0ABV8MTF2_9NEIS